VIVCNDGRSSDVHGVSEVRNSVGFPQDRPRNNQATFPSKILNRLILTFVSIAVLPMLVCHGGVASAQNDPLNNAYKPTVDCNPADYPSNIALSGPLVKLRQDSGSPNGVYGAAPCVTIYAAQNEFQSFQVHVQAPSGGYSALNVTMSALSKTTGPGANYTIPAPSTSAVDIVVYREGYIHITTPTCFDAPTCLPTLSSPTGYYPDPLIPAVDPYWHQTTTAFPVSVAAGQNQSAWIDVYIPQATPSGWYLGSVTISNGGTTLATMPVLYGVWQWPADAGGYMPSTATLHTMEFTGYQSLCRQAYGLNGTTCANYPGSGGSADYGDVVSKEDLAVQLLDNRLTLASVATSYFPTAADTTLENGTTMPTGRVQRIMSGSKLGAVYFQCPGNCNFGTGQNAQTDIPAFMNTMNSNGWLNSQNNGAFYYDVDEPGLTCSNWTTAIANANASRTHTSAPLMPMLITSWIQAATACSGLNAVDWMIAGVIAMEPSPQNYVPGVTPGVNFRSSYNSWLAGNCCGTGSPQRQLWAYGACGNTGTCTNGYPASGDSTQPAACGTTWVQCGIAAYYPTWDVDSVPVANRANEWNTFREQESGELYYLLDGCFYYSCGGTTDPWSSVYEYGNNGDGDLLYPGSNSTGTSKLAAQIGVSVPIWIPSIRLKMMRDGVQDYEYLNLLTNDGNGSFVQSEISSWITNGYTYDTNPSGLTNARQAFGQAIHQQTYPVTLQPQPPTTLKVTLQGP
jgi:hypothetical protein